MSAPGRRQLLALAACALGVASSSTPSSPASESIVALDASTRPARAAADGARWLRSTRAALDNAKAIRIPSVEIGALTGRDSTAAAFAFDALGGQTLEVTLTRDAARSGEPVYVEVFRVVEVLGRPLHERLTGLRPSASRLRARLPSDGPYHVLVQTVESGTADYRLTLEIGPALPFPVVGAERSAIRGLFGASRDAGRRYHQGVDIFVQRLTPVLAVASGRAMPRHDALGGNTVWLNTPGTSYYYAHLDRVAVRDQQNVKAGDVLGYVGNTGNATGMSPHLHFGVYRWGREPIDPLPLLVGQRLDSTPAAAADGG
jgi:murein DD-endopeptidase MepM/ murein hydrolase activator NlpD